MDHERIQKERLTQGGRFYRTVEREAIRVYAGQEGKVEKAPSAGQS